jgi:hypothetical protein
MGSPQRISWLRARVDPPGTGHVRPGVFAHYGSIYGLLVPEELPLVELPLLDESVVPDDPVASLLPPMEPLEVSEALLPVPTSLLPLLLDVVPVPSRVVWLVVFVLRDFL